ncbi:MAG: DEAD/DEAH box helicase [Burkholderiaceae bacterium]|nr:DEAD/DEAH box helicase [Microbacteriaceae bacterium]
MTPAAPPLVDVADIVRLVGDGSFRRGQAYARGGAVERFDWDPETNRLSGTVAGGAPSPYSCTVEIVAGANGRSRLTVSSCSCPMDYDCKHVAATIVSANAEHIRQLGLSSRRTAAEWADERSAQSRESAAHGFPGEAEVADDLPAWKAALGAMAAPAATSTPLMYADSGMGLVSVAPRHSMALQFELREQAPRAQDRWRGSPSRRRAGSNETASARLGVRPVMRNARGTWVKGSLTWGNILYQVNRLNLEPEQHRWFCQFVPLHRASSEVYLGQDGDWLFLDDFNSPLLWHLFTEATRLGIELVTTTKGLSVMVGARAELTLDVREAEVAGRAGAAERAPGAETLALDTTTPAPDIRLEPRLAIDGRDYPVAAASAIGAHGVYVAGSERIVLAPTAGPLGAEQRWLLSATEPVTAPGRDAAEFLTDFYPRLRRTLRVTSSDATVALPEVVPPVLVLTATFGAKDSLALAWHWEYRDGSTAVRMPIDPERSLESELRDQTAEREILDRLRETAVPVPTALQGLDAAEYTERVLPVLEDFDGVRVDISGKRPAYRELTDVPELTISTVETDERDWFDLGVMVKIGGRSIPFGPIFTALAKGKTKLLLVDKTYLSLEQPVFERLHELIEEAKALQEWDTGLRISRYQASLWSEFEDLAEETDQAVSWRSAVAGLLELAADAGAAGVGATAVPEAINATLRPYQAEGFAWLAFLWRHRLGGVLADDMGLGKTLQSLALICHAREQHALEQEKHAQPADVALPPFLVVAPTSVVGNWVLEAARFAPGLKVVSLTATESKSRATLADLVAGADIVVTSYTLFRIDNPAYTAQVWSGLILDEAQFVKNATSLAHRCAKDFDVPFKLAITGTPMENNLMELWSLFSIVAPGLFPSSRKFAEVYQRPIERGAPEPLATLRRRIRPLMMRRTKDLVAKDLPAKQEQVLRIDLAPKHRKIYETFLQRERQKLLGLIEDIDKNRFIIFRSLTLLRMLSLDASLVDDKFTGVPSSKLDALFEQLEDVIAEGHRSLIFSQFTSFLGMAAARLDAAGIDYCYLDGSSTNRADIIRRFKEGSAPVFLISLKAGGFGLNLTEADYVFLLDPWWNPATETQAVDRTHRIGQTRNVMVYRLVATDTIEEKVMALKEQKAKLFTAVLDDDAVFSSALTADDIRGLLE